MLSSIREIERQASLALRRDESSRGRLCLNPFGKDTETEVPLNDEYKVDFSLFLEILATSITFVLSFKRAWLHGPAFWMVSVKLTQKHLKLLHYR